MPAAIIQTTIVQPPLTIATVGAGLNLAMQKTGLSLLDSWTITTTENHYLYQNNFNAQAAKGTAFFEIWVTSGTRLRCNLYDGWNNATRVGSNGGTNIDTILSFTTNQIIFTSYNHPELKMINVFQSGTINANFGIFRPANKRTWWNETQHLYCFMLDGTSTFNGFRYCNSNPIGANNLLCSFYSNNAFANSNPNDADSFEINSGLLLCYPTAGGFQCGSIGKTSDDFIFACASGKKMGDIYPPVPGVEEYTLISDGGTPGYGIRSI